MDIRFWGVRGSVAVSGSQVAGIGGNTPCVEVTSQGHRIILDAGTGVRALGETMLKESPPRKALMLFSHLHWDHVQGFPFFTPAYLPDTELSLFGPGQGGDVELLKVLRAQMQPPTFPVTLDIMRSKMSFAAAVPGQPLEYGPFRITPIELNHPNGCVGYRIESDGHSFVYATDVELSLETLSRTVASAFEGVDALCLDAQYTPEEYAGKNGLSKRGWGHSTVVDAARIAQATSARHLYLFHHDPAHNDDMVASMADRAHSFFKDAEPAREGALIHLPRCA